MKALVAQSSLTLSEPMDYGLPGSSVCEILQARTLDWFAIPFSRDLPHPGIEPRSPVLQEPLKFNSYSKVLSCA